MKLLKFFVTFAIAMAAAFWTQFVYLDLGGSESSAFIVLLACSMVFGHLAGKAAAYWG